MSFYYEVIPTKIFRAGASTLTYSSEKKLSPGSIVYLPLGRTTCPGIVYRSVSKPSFPCKPISRLLYSTPLPLHLLKAIVWLSNYYLTPLPSVASLFLPVGVEKKRRNKNIGRLYNPRSCSIPQEPEKRFLRVQEKKVRWPVLPEPHLSELDYSEKSFPGVTRTEQKPDVKPNNNKIALNPYQQTALSELNQIKNTTKLLFGITGSGKTNIYLELARKTLETGRSVILLVPEIALTSQLVEIFEHTFPGRTLLLHSRLTESERHLLWEQILESTSTAPENTPSDAPEPPSEPSLEAPATPQPLIIIGPRSALLAPVSNLGLIIVDECHESSYFQENTPKYSALRLASFIAKTLNITCLLGSATPLVSDFYLARSKNSLVSLTKKAKTAALTPDIKIVDLTDKSAFSRNRYFSNPLLSLIKSNLASGLQTLIYHNRRGSAPLTLCESCGWQALCPTCFLPLTLHSDSYSLICHTCGFKEKLPSSCPSCHHPSILHKGFGTKLLETELKKLFPDARIARFDADNNKTNSLDALYPEVKSGEINLLIGTQTLSRGLDLPYLASIGIVQADAGLSLPDFSAEEKTFELLTQVIGRVGRGHLSTASVLIQTFQPSSSLISFATTENYPAFYEYLIKKRKKQLLPPFAYLARLTVTNKTEATTLKKIRLVSKSLVSYLAKSSPNLSKPFQISPPMPCFHERTNSGYSWQIIIKSTNRSALLSLLSSLDKKLSVHISLDPPSLL